MIPFFETDFALLASVLLAIVAIVFILVRRGTKEASNATIHTWYISGIAAFIIIELVTYVCINNDYSSEIVKIVSFGATLSSIILSILAIFITVTSSNSVLRVKDSLDDLSRSVPKTIEESLKKIDSSSESINISFKDNLAAQRDNIQEIQVLLRKLGETITEGFSNSRDSISEVKNMLANSTRSIQSTEVSINLSEDQIKSFVNETSYLSLELIFLIRKILQLKIKQPFDLMKLSQFLGEDENELGTYWYLYACLVILSSFGLIEYQTQKGMKDIFFTKISQILSDEAENQLSKRSNFSVFRKKVDDFLSGFDKTGETDDNGDLEN